MYLLYFVLWIIFNGAVTTEICIFRTGDRGRDLCVYLPVHGLQCEKREASVPAHFQNAAVHFQFWSREIIKAEFCSHSYDPLGKRGN